MGTLKRNISNKKAYSKPEVTRVALDNSIALVMMTVGPINPPPRGGSNKGSQDGPFASPFGDKAFD